MTYADNTIFPIHSITLRDSFIFYLQTTLSMENKMYQAVFVMGLKEGVKAYLDKFAETNEEFKTKYETSGKSVEGFCNYLIEEFMVKPAEQLAKASGKNYAGMQLDDQTCYNLAVKYFLDDNIVEKKEEPKPKIVPPTATTTATTATTKPTKKSPSEKYKKKEEKKVTTPTPTPTTQTTPLTSGSKPKKEEKKENGSDSPFTQLSLF